MLQALSNAGASYIPQARYQKFDNERSVVAGFVARVNALGTLANPSPALQKRLMDEVRGIARRLDMSREKGSPAEFVRRVLYEDPTRWSLAAIILRPGQEIYAHDHGGWGCAVTVQGIERDRRLILDANGEHRLISEIDYGPGKGYSFNPLDIHQPVGADPRQVTVALHFLVLEPHAQKEPHQEPPPTFRNWLRVM